MVVPPSQLEDIILHYHVDLCAHACPVKTHHAVIDGFPFRVQLALRQISQDYFHVPRVLVQACIASCMGCQAKKQKEFKGASKMSTAPPRPRYKIQLDAIDMQHRPIKGKKWLL